MNQNELYHYGVKGQQWGVRRGPPYPIGEKKPRQKADKPSPHHLTTKQRKLVVAGAVAVSSVLAMYGVYKISKTGGLNGAILRGKLAAQSAGDDFVAGFGTHTVTQIGTVDFGDKNAILSVLKTAEADCQNLTYEVNTTVTSDGLVWRVSGDAGFVDFSKIPSNLAGSYSYHNHPIGQSNYSFSRGDMASFIGSRQALSMASDHRFIYVVRRRPDTLEKPPDWVYHRFKEIYYGPNVMGRSVDGVLDIDLDGYHETVKALCKELNIDYVRMPRQ